MTEGWAWIEGKIVPLGEARIPITDRGYLLGDGVFETLRARDGRVLQRERHARRLLTGLRLLGIETASPVAWTAVDELLPRAPADAYVRVQATTGHADEFGGEAGRHSVTALVRAYRPYPRRAYDLGLTLAIAESRKPITPLSAVKSLSFLPHVDARRQARELGVDDAILLNDAGRICEATTSNVFAVRNGEIFAPGPPEGAVDGVVRSVLLDRFEQEGASIHPRFSHDEMARADEVFLTNTMAGCIAARSLDGRALAGPRGTVYQGARLFLDANGYGQGPGAPYEKPPASLHTSAKALGLP